MNDEKITRSYYAIIPANVRYDGNLTPNAKLLYGEITALCNEKGFCWASNDYFSKLYKVSKTSISKWISSLVERRYISIELVYKEGTKQILNRYLRIVNDPIEEKLNTPIEEKLKDNNTIINNTINNTNNKKVRKKESKKSFDEIIETYTPNEELQEEIKNHLATRKAKKATLTNRAIELSLKKLDDLVKDKPVNDQENEKIKIVQQSIERGWIGFFTMQDNNNFNNNYNNKRKQNNDGWEYLNQEFNEIYKKKENDKMPF